MKKVLSLVILVALTSFAIRCGDTTSPVSQGGQEYDTPRTLKTVAQPDVERVFAEVVVPYDTFLIDWTDSPLSMVSVINSLDDMERNIPSKMLDIMRKEGYPSIDYSKNSLLVAMGYTPTLINAIEKQLLQTSKNEYELKVVLDLTDATAPDKWIVAILTDKISESGSVRLIVLKKEYLLGCDGGKHPLDGTSWKLIGIVEVKTGLLNELEPKDCERCYTLTFDTDTVHYFSSSNTAIGPYNIDYVTCSISIPKHILTTKVGEWGDGMLWVETLPKIEKFALQKDVLKLYYSNGKNYFLFKPLSKGVVYD